MVIESNNVKIEGWGWDLFLYLMLVLLSGASDQLRYLKYATILMAVISIVNNKRIYLRDMAMPFVILGMAALLEVPLNLSGGLKNAFILFSAGLPFLIVRKYIVNVLYVNISVFVVFVTFNIDNFNKSYGMDILNSQSTFEGYYAFVFGAFAVYYLIKRNKVMTLINCVLAVVALKRIVLLAVIVCAVVLIIPGRIKKIILSPIFGISVNMIYLIFTLLFSNGVFDEISKNLTDLSANALSQGRQVIWKKTANEIASNPGAYILFGLGPDGALKLTPMKTIDDSWLLHNDVLKIFSEYGAIVFIIFFYYLYKSRHLEIKIFALYFNLLMLTDNVLLYAFVVFFLIFLSSLLVFEKLNFRAQE